MQTKNELFIDLLDEPDTQYVIPAYQRLYSWKQRQCKELWLDLHRANKAGRKHFLGTFLYSLDADDSHGFKRHAVIDGQQRLTTITILLVALARYLKSHGDISLPDIDAQTIENRFLHVSAVVPDTEYDAADVNEADTKPAATDVNVSYSKSATPDAGNADSATPAWPGKLVLSHNDRETLFSIIEGEELPAKASKNILDSLAFFRSRMEEDGFDPERLWNGINLLFVICAQVDNADNAQLIFESLNSKGLPLTTADLVRNYLLLSEDHAEQTRLYDEYWSAIEGMFMPDPNSLRLDNAIQGWLSVRFRKVRAKGVEEVYSVFKQYVEDEFSGTAESLLRELRSFCLVWAENYHYHAVKKYKSNFNWASNGSHTLVSHYEKQDSSNKEYAERVRKDLDDIDTSY